VTRAAAGVDDVHIRQNLSAPPQNPSPGDTLHLVLCEGPAAAVGPAATAVPFAVTVDRALAATRGGAEGLSLQVHRLSAASSSDADAAAVLCAAAEFFQSSAVVIGLSHRRRGLGELLTGGGGGGLEAALARVCERCVRGRGLAAARAAQPLPHRCGDDRRRAPNRHARVNLNAAGRSFWCLTPPRVARRRIRRRRPGSRAASSSPSAAAATRWAPTRWTPYSGPPIICDAAIRTYCTSCTWSPWARLRNGRA